MRLVLYPSIEAERLEKLKAAAGRMEVVNCESEEGAAAAIGEAQAFIGKITPALLERAPNLKWVQAPTASLEHYVFPELIQHPCRLTNMRGLYSDVIAEQVFGYMLAFERNLHRYVRLQAEGRWEPLGSGDGRPDSAYGPSRTRECDRLHGSLADKTLGVFGFGHIGEEVGKRALAFQMRVIGMDPEKTVAPGGVEGIWSPDRLPDLLRLADYLVIAAPHTPETEKAFRGEQFRMMKKSAYLINVGRGVIVDLADLTAALEAGEIAGAALDVVEQEPLPAEHPLWRMENVILTPHTAGFSPRIADRHLSVLLENIERFRSGDELLNVVDKARWF